MHIAAYMPRCYHAYGAALRMLWLWVGYISGSSIYAILYIYAILCIYIYMHIYIHIMLYASINMEHMFPAQQLRHSSSSSKSEDSEVRKSKMAEVQR